MLSRFLKQAIGRLVPMGKQSGVLDAVVGETVFVIAVDFVSVCPSVFVGRAPQIDGVRARYATRCSGDG